MKVCGLRHYLSRTHLPKQEFFFVSTNTTLQSDCCWHVKMKLAEDKGNSVGNNYLKYNVCQINVDLMNSAHCVLIPYDNFMKSF